MALGSVSPNNVKAEMYNTELKQWLAIDDYPFAKYYICNLVRVFKFQIIAEFSKRKLYLKLLFTYQINFMFLVDMSTTLRQMLFLATQTNGLTSVA